MNSTLERPSFDAFLAGTYQEPETGLYIVDWDTPVSSLVDLRAYYDRIYPPSGPLTVHQVEGVDAIWDDTQKVNLSYCVSNTFGDKKQRVIDAMAQATGGWMDAADVAFRYVPEQDSTCTSSNNNVLFDVNPDDSGQFVARAFFPGQERSTRNVIIDNSAFDIDDDDIFSLNGVLEHELGHALGWRHEHVRANIFNIPFENWLGCVLEGFIDQNYRPVTEYDSASVMHYPQCGGDGILRITPSDIEGAQQIYGPPQG